MFTKRLFLTALVVIAAAMTIGTAGAGTNFAFVSSGETPWGPFYNFQYTGTTDDDGFGWDLVMLVCYNGDGAVMDTDLLGIPVGVTGITGEICDVGILAGRVDPVQFEVRDITTVIMQNDRSQMPAILAAPAVLTYSTSGGQAAQIPPGFLQHHIVCDTPVYDTPGGTPVGDNMVTAGQAWHTSPNPEPGPDGQNWTAIHVGGSLPGYIPTSCVGGLTVFGEMAQYE
jgi:hypothetical protein